MHLSSVVPPHQVTKSPGQMTNLQGREGELLEKDPGRFGPFTSLTARVTIISKMCFPPKPNGFIHQKGVLCMQTNHTHTHENKHVLSWSKIKF